MHLILKPFAALIWSSLILLAMPLGGAVVTATFTSATTVPVTAASYTATGNTVDLSLGYAPTTGTTLVVVIGSFGALAGKLVAAICASGAHSMALCADGTLAAWGWNKYGQLGLTGVTQSNVPAAIDLSGVAAGRGLTQIALGGNHSLARFTDGTLAAWGDNASGSAARHNLALFGLSALS